MQTCRRCLYPSSHPLGLTFNADGLCSGCSIHDEKDSLDWNHRWEELNQLVTPYRCSDSRNFDCIVPISGAGDSYFIIHTVVNRLKLKPLLVTHNRYYNTPLGIHSLANLRRKFNVDILIQNVNPYSVKKIIRTTLRRLGSFHWPAIAGQTVFPVQTAVSHKIPLIIWGAHQGLEQVGMFSHLHNVEMNRRYRKDHDLMGLEADDLLSNFDNLREEDIWQYRYPSWDEINDIGVRGIYLGNYMRWDPLAQHHEMVKLYNYKSARQPRTFDTFDYIDDWHYTDTHDWIKFQKHGFGKALDHACREIRHKRISREQGIVLSNYYQRIPPRNQSLLLNWLELPKNTFNFIINHHQESHHTEENKAVILSDCKIAESLLSEKWFPESSTLNQQQASNHITIGKGYP